MFCHVWLFVYLDKCSFPTTSPALYVGGDVLMIILSGLVAGSTALKLSALREECSLSFVFCVLNSRRNQACLIQILLLFSGKPPGEALDDEWNHLASPETIEPIDSELQIKAVPPRMGFNFRGHLPWERKGKSAFFSEVWNPSPDSCRAELEAQSSSPALPLCPYIPTARLCKVLPWVSVLGSIKSPFPLSRVHPCGTFNSYRAPRCMTEPRHSRLLE